MMNLAHLKIHMMYFSTFMFYSVKMSKIYYSKLIIYLGFLLLGTQCREETIENVVHRLNWVIQKIIISSRKENKMKLLSE